MLQVEFYINSGDFSTFMSLQKIKILNYFIKKKSRLRGLEAAAVHMLAPVSFGGRRPCGLMPQSDFGVLHIL